ncbi:MAG: hypothetical protein U0989_02600 [Azonexus sp.]|nr:hypothetical protein [Azonexus sp.]MDP3636983.1 hypothetical protein [Azonexus sp.]MDZ4313656.1 hypothetical protein [Azonexus sp.]
MNTTPTHEDPEVKAEMAKHFRKINAQREIIKIDRIHGEAALRRLLPVALGNSGQSRRIASLLLGCYNGTRFPFDLTNLRSLDYTLMEDCMAVLRMDANCYQEVHTYFENGGQIFEQLARDWNLEKKASAS